jgi:DNA-binding transcriptional regulator YiaG
VSQNSKQRLLAYAVERLGRDGLAKRLQASADDVAQWMDGAEMPSRKALALADLIAELDDVERR